MRLRPNVALQQTGRLLMKDGRVITLTSGQELILTITTSSMPRESRARLLIALQLNLGVRRTLIIHL
jgi:hypothetical protein